MKRPISVTLMSFVFMIAGVSGMIYHAEELKKLASDPEVSWVFIVRLAAVAGGWFALRGKNWARWLLVTWIVYHVYVSSFHEMTEVAIHVLFAVLTVLALFNKKSNAYFESRQ